MCTESEQGLTVAPKGSKKTEFLAMPAAIPCRAQIAAYAQRPLCGSLYHSRDSWQFQQLSTFSEYAIALRKADCAEIVLESAASLVCDICEGARPVSS